ncbi:cell division protein ZapE [Fulvimarina sp. 2208YS6-2-32]|uniref:Cell division protein ZapE n=1 Tax=Fulvimarina uroteuthidis TaxID=3098149 RepID=A0ABU5I652_9HYPH|nr:cell division protein ZapE [Fulvimarina sp. 2208YS6-2-32]MDY8110854.1 cell division protein ZapE [Fulvimarina sp. 2208YS6-2-32]
MANPSSRTDRKRWGPVRAKLERLIETGEIEADPAQKLLADRLDRLDHDLSNRSVATKSSALGWMFGKKGKPEKVDGLYVYGAVGRGKTMVMDMFYRQSSVSRKRRVHFHAFMGDVHDRITAHRYQVKEGTASQDDPIPPVARQIAAESLLLCFDEFSVTDVTDAMILSRLFEALFAEGVVLVATSNVDPDDLYKDGLNRGLFLPFVEKLKAHVEILALDGGEDYRMAAIGTDDLYITPLDENAEGRVDKVWNALLSGASEHAASLSVKGRTIQVPRSGNGAARFSYEALLGQPLGAQDYIALAKRFHTVILEGVPALTKSERNEAKRLINLVDTFYDAGRRLVISAEVPAKQLYSAPSGTEKFEFDRTVSRLFEMRGDTYMAGDSEPVELA